MRIRYLLEIVLITLFLGHVLFLFWDFRPLHSDLAD